MFQDKRLTLPLECMKFALNAAQDTLPVIPTCGGEMLGSPISVNCTTNNSRCFTWSTTARWHSAMDSLQVTVDRIST